MSSRDDLNMKDLNKLGDEGWELVSVTVKFQIDEYTYYMAFLKRPKQ